MKMVRQGSYRCGISRYQEIRLTDMLWEVNLQGRKSMQCWQGAVPVNLQEKAQGQP